MCTRMLISIECMYHHMKAKEEYTVQIHILVYIFQIWLIMP